MKNRRTCPTPTKRPYFDEIKAKLALSRIANVGPRDGVRMPVRAYPCACGAWHLSSRA